MAQYVFKNIETCKQCRTQNIRTQFSEIYCDVCDDYTYRYELDNDKFYDTIYDFNNNSDNIEIINNTIYLPYKYDDYDTSEIKLVKYIHKNMIVYIICHLLTGNGCGCGVCTNYSDTQTTYFIYFEEDNAKNIFDLMKTTNYLYESKKQIEKSYAEL